MSVPDEVREQLKQRLWETADSIGWINLSQGDKAKYYATWIDDETIGGILSRYIDKGSVRVYIKDTLLKPYSRERHREYELPKRVLGLPSEIAVTRAEIKPHTIWLEGGNVISWGRANNWKNIVLCLFERTYADELAIPYGVVFDGAVGHYASKANRDMIEDAARRLGIEQVRWLDT